MDKPVLDPYVYPNSTILINKFNTQNAQTLESLEAQFFASRCIQGIPDGNLDYVHLKTIHYHIFQDIYDWAGKERTIMISKGSSLFAYPDQIEPYLNKVFGKLTKDDYLTNLGFSDFCDKASYYFGEINAVHPFREGNGRTQRLFLDKTAENAGYKLFWEKVDRVFYIEASIHSFNGNHEKIKEVFTQITEPLTKKISR